MLVIGPLYKWPPFLYPPPCAVIFVAVRAIAVLLLACTIAKKSRSVNKTGLVFNCQISLLFARIRPSGRKVTPGYLRASERLAKCYGECSPFPFAFIPLFSFGLNSGREHPA